MAANSAVTLPAGSTTTRIISPRIAPVHSAQKNSRCGCTATPGRVFSPLGIVRP